MAEVQHLVGLAPGEHVGEMADAEAHLGAEGGGEQFLRRGRWRRSLAGGSRQLSQLPQARGRLLAEMAEQDRAAAAGGLDEAGERVEPLALARRGAPARPRSRSAAGRGRNPRRPRTARPRPARRRGRRGRSPDNKPRSISGCRHGRRSARPACRCPCRRRWSRPSPSPPNATNAAWLRARTGGSSPA